MLSLNGYCVIYYVMFIFKGLWLFRFFFLIELELYGYGKILGEVLKCGCD